MKFLTHLGSLCLASACVMQAAQAAVVVEGENNGQMTNNGRLAAQNIAAASFTTDVNPLTFAEPGDLTATVQGVGSSDNDIDFYRFTTTDVFNLEIDIDGAFDLATTAYDTQLALFNSSSELIALADAGSAVDDPGSQGGGADAFLGTYFLLDPGTYFVAVTMTANFPLEFLSPTLAASSMDRPDRAQLEAGGFTGGFRVEGAGANDNFFANGDQDAGHNYTMHISLRQIPAPVPVPAALPLLLSGIAALAGLTAKARKTA